MPESRSSWDYMWGGLDGTFRDSLQAFVQASGGRLVLLSGYRSTEHQQELWDAAVLKYGEANAPRWVARPGSSNHNHGVAADLRFVGDGAKEWAHQNAARFGLVFPMGHEPWHIEPIGLRTGDYVYADGDGHAPTRESYTLPAPGVRHAMDLTRGAVSSSIMNRLLTGPLPPASAIDEDRLMEGPVDASAPTIAGPVEEVTDAAQ